MFQKVLLGICAINIIIVKSIFLTSLNYNLDEGETYTNQTFNFIIVGSGPTGAVIANRLSEVPEWNVLLIEAGPVPTDLTDIPSLCGSFSFTDYNWGYRAERQEHFCRGCINKTLKYSHGKVLGGTSIINFMLHVRGNRRDYDKWANLGNPGWSFKEVLPYFQKSEDFNVDGGDEGFYNKGGYLSISDVPFRTGLVDALVKSGQESGYPYVDYNGKEQIGVSHVQAHLRNGRRCSAEKAFLRPAAARSNLKILTNSRVVQILIDRFTKKAYGVQYAKDKQYFNVFAKKEVIVSAGGLNSPQLLMLSGIGPKEDLEQLDIPVIADLPVGKKMYDHPAFLGLTYEINQNIVLVQDEIFGNVTEVFKFWKLGTGALTCTGGVEGLLYFKSKVSDDPDPLNPDVELIFLAGTIAADNGQLYTKLFNVPRDTYDRIWKIYEKKPAYQIMPMLTHPKSFGFVKLASKNPFRWPKYYANFLSDPQNHDIKTFIAAIREIQRISTSPTLKQLGATIVRTPLPGCEHLVFDSDEYWECGIRSLTSSVWHQVSTCKMGPKADPEAVVNNKGEVYGVENLRVADTSIIPFPLSAHTTGPSYMIGERISDFIKDKWEANTV
ncbi:glucose dehydrogenase [FAD, quinone]-like [Diabrotica undecimpunctata]|uniref:glucose dehydrogenase [FAD, quinone]-like n=1 Tax=Diabrotica undecimpunctata TaxID=50387 RepID=UPI003B641D18